MGFGLKHMGQSPKTMLPRAPFRKWPNYFMAHCAEALRPLIHVYGSARARRAPSAPQTWRKGLLIGETHIGDVLYNTGSLPHLHSGLPNCQWFYLTEQPAAEVLKTNPYLADVIEAPRPFDRSKDARQIFTMLREQDFDVALCYNSGRYWPDLLLSARLGIPNLF